MTHILQIFYFNYYLIIIKNGCQEFGKIATVRGTFREKTYKGKKSFSSANYTHFLLHFSFFFFYQSRLYKGKKENHSLHKTYADSLITKLARKQVLVVP